MTVKELIEKLKNCPEDFIVKYGEREFKISTVEVLVEYDRVDGRFVSTDRKFVHIE
jgi:hypothetical protein